MADDRETIQELRNDIEELRCQLQEAGEALEAIGTGAVDAVVMRKAGVNQVFSLEGAERPYRVFVEEMQQGALTLARNGTVLYCNHRFAEMLQCDASEVAGSRFEDHLSPGSREAWHTLMRIAATAPRGAGELNLQRRDGSTLRAFAAVCPLVAQQGTSLALVVSDLTEQKQFERLAVAERRLEEALGAAQQASRAKDHFLALLGHELRNPLAPIRNSVALMKLAGTDDPIIKSAREMIDRQVTNLTRLIDDLLDVSRISSGKIALHKAGMDLGEVVAATVAAHRPMLEAAGMRVTYDGPPGPMAAFGDATRIDQIVSNLLVNAGKFTDRGGRVDVRLNLDPEGKAVITVTDTGIGMEPVLMEHLFEPFMQAGQPTDRSGGLGLGLTLVQGLARLHGGHAQARSGGPGQGSEFTVVLPVLTGTFALEPERPPEAAREVVPKRILVIEDNRDSAETLRMLLALSGHRVQVAHTGAEGLAMAKAEPPEVILCDIGLPGGMDGYEVVQAIQGIPELRSTYLVAMTGFGQDEDRMRAVQAGFHNHLTKPADPDELLCLLARISSAASSGPWRSPWPSRRPGTGSRR
jgi:PAS domain S-box-containing protein